jgi:hypothetical protein
MMHSDTKRKGSKPIRIKPEKHTKKILKKSRRGKLEKYKKGEPQPHTTPPPIQPTNQNTKTHTHQQHNLQHNQKKKTTKNKTTKNKTTKNKNLAILHLRSNADASLSATIHLFSP